MNARRSHFLVNSSAGEASQQYLRLVRDAWRGTRASQSKSLLTCSLLACARPPRGGRRHPIRQMGRRRALTTHVADVALKLHVISRHLHVDYWTFVTRTGDDAPRPPAPPPASSRNSSCTRA